MKAPKRGSSRPASAKIAPLPTETQKHAAIRLLLRHAGQHSDEEMSHCFFQDLGQGRPFAQQISKVDGKSRDEEDREELLRMHHSFRA